MPHPSRPAPASSAPSGAWRPPYFGLVLGALLIGVAPLACDQTSGYPEGSPASEATAPAALEGAPRDYVLEPVVVDEERNCGPERLISTAPCLTELAFALGLGGRLVGRSQYCRHPPQALEVPVVGAYTDANLESIVAANANLVLITTSSPRLRRQFLALELPLVELPDSSIEDVFQAAEMLGEAVGRPRTAALLVENLQKDLEALTRRGAGPQVLMVTGPLPVPPRGLFVAGPNSYLDHLIQRAGGRNALQGHMHRPWGEVSLEQLLAANPDVILEARSQKERIPREMLYDSWAPLNEVTALRERRVHNLPLWVLYPGPRVNRVLHAIASALEP